MKLHLMFLLMDILMILFCGYLWLKAVLVHAMRRLENRGFRLCRNWPSGRCARVGLEKWND
ncbi:MAG: hypothetical protein C4586_07855 [Anaerolineaceae bacterium]|nr:MAG: hypothetical protein C4586_07855 [Anaerolineaceae bacterium]